MRTKLILAAAILASQMAQASEPRIDSWITSRLGRYARIYTNATVSAARTPATTWSNGSQTQSLPAYTGVQEVSSSSNWVYIRTTGLGHHIMGPWSVNFPNLPANQHGFYRFPRNPVAPSAATAKTLTGNGTIGFFVDGVAMFDSRDAHYWNGTTDDVGGTGNWNREAYVNEGDTFDPAYAHQENTGTYHYHANPVALRYLLGDHVDYNPVTQTYSESTNPVTAHSPVLGWVADGFPIYGPYGYANTTNPASGIRRMSTGYHLRNGSMGTDNLATVGRTSLPAWATRIYSSGGVATGPAVSSTYPLGRYMEDNAYLGDLGYVQGQDFDLDAFNGRYCVTPEFPKGTYAYFVSIAADGTPVFPYNIGRAYYGTPTAGAVTTRSETVSTNYLGGADAAIVLNTMTVSNQMVELVWSAVEGGTYRVDSTSDLKNWTTNGTPTVATGNSASANLSASQPFEFFRVRLTSIASYDSVTNANTNGGGGPGGPGGGGNPTLGSVSPSSGSRGTTVTLTMGLGPMAPPVGINPISASLGTIAGTRVMRSGSNVTAAFAIPSSSGTGPVNVSVVFPGPPGMGNVTFSLVNGFTIL